MKFWGLLLVCAAVSSIECEEDIVPEYPIKTAQEAAEALSYITNADGEFLEIMLENRPEKLATELLKAIEEIQLKEGQKNISVKNALSIACIKSEEIWGVISLLKRMVEEKTRNKNWEIKSKSLYGQSALLDSEYLHRVSPVTKEKERKLFDEKIRLHNKLQAPDIIPQIIACRIGYSTAEVISVVGKNEGKLYLNSDSAEISGVNRGKIYMRAGMMLLLALNANCLIKKIDALDVHINPSKFNATRFSIFGELYPQEPYLEEFRVQLGDKIPSNPNMNLAEFHAKHLLKNFIEKSEKIREENIKNVKTLNKKQKNNKKSTLAENKKALPLAFTNIINSMLTSTKSLEEIVKDIQDLLEKEEIRSNLLSDSLQQPSNSSIHKLQKCSNCKFHKTQKLKHSL